MAKWAFPKRLLAQLTAFVEVLKRHPAMGWALAAASIALLVVSHINTLVSFYDTFFYSPEVEVEELKLIGVWAQRTAQPGWIPSPIPLIGISAIAKVKNGRLPAPVGRLSIDGDVYPEFQFAGASAGLLRDGETLDESAQEWQKRKPFQSVSWRAWPSGSLVVMLEPYAEELVKYDVCAPEAYAMTTTTVYEGDSPADYFGFADGTKAPKYVTARPTPHLLFGLRAIGKDMFRPTLRPELKDDLRFSITVARSQLAVPKDRISFRAVSQKDWEALPLLSIFEDDTLPVLK